MLCYAPIDEAVFSMRSAPSNSRVTALCNPFLIKCGQTHVINNRDGVFRGVYAEYLKEK
jgi:hypothetical protein